MWSLLVRRCWIGRVVDEKDEEVEESTCGAEVLMLLEVSESDDGADWWRCGVRVWWSEFGVVIRAF